MFLTDANVFIEAKNRYYDFDICPGFWDWMDAQVPEMKVCSIKPVYNELAGGGDSLSRWVKDRRADGRFLKVDDVAAQTFFARVAATVQAGAFKPEARPSSSLAPTHGWWQRPAPSGPQSLRRRSIRLAHNAGPRCPTSVRRSACPISIPSSC